jgi:hypothetical protein
MAKEIGRWRKLSHFGFKATHLSSISRSFISRSGQPFATPAVT